MIAITDTKCPAARSDSPAQGQSIDSRVDEAIRRRVAACPYGFIFDKITWHVDAGTLTLRGCVPSFYLKQTLQELLLSIGQIDRIENDVAVVSSTGLSSDRSSKTR